MPSESSTVRYELPEVGNHATAVTGMLAAALAHFDQVFVLTLRRSPERQRLMRELLTDVDFEFVYGVDCDDVSFDELERTHVIDAALMLEHDLQRLPLRPGMIACSLSHRMLYERIAASGVRRVLILEDDLELAPAALPGLLAALKELPVDWEVLYLDYRQAAEPSWLQRLVQMKHAAQSLAGQFPLSVPAIMRRFATPYSTHLVKPGYFFYTSAYAITPSAARTLLRLQTPVSYAPDHLLAKACTEHLVNAFALRTRVFEQYSLRTGDRLTV